MRPPRLPIRLWILMASIAVIAIALQGYKLWKLSRLYRLGAEMAAHNQRIAEAHLAFLQSTPGGGPSTVAYQRELASYFANVSRFYGEAARTPWLSHKPHPGPPQE